MNKTFKENINAWEISTDASHIIHRIGGEDYPILRRAIVTDRVGGGSRGGYSAVHNSGV